MSARLLDAMGAGDHLLVKHHLKRSDDLHDIDIGKACELLMASANGDRQPLIELLSDSATSEHVEEANTKAWATLVLAGALNNLPVPRVIDRLISKIKLQKVFLCLPESLIQKWVFKRHFVFKRLVAIYGKKAFIDMNTYSLLYHSDELVPFILDGIRDEIGVIDISDIVANIALLGRRSHTFMDVDAARKIFIKLMYWKRGKANAEWLRDNGWLEKMKEDSRLWSVVEETESYLK